MLTSDPKHQFEELKDQLLNQIGQTFPIQDKSGQYEVRVKNLRVEDNLGVDDIKGQFKAKMEGRSWAAPVTGTIEIVDTVSGKTLVSRKNAQIAKLPKLTRHYSYIVGGSEKFIANQWRLRPGVYVKATQKEGEFEAQFQLAKGKSFDLQTGKGGELQMKIGGRKIPLYSVLSAFGVSDDAMKKAWGDAAFEASKKKARPEKDLKSLYESWRREPMSGKTDPSVEIKALFEGTRMDPVVAEANVGIHSEKVTDKVLFEASKKLLDVAAKRQDPDPIDSLRYKELWTAKDQFVERIAHASDDIMRRIQSSMSKKSIKERLHKGDHSVVRDVFMPDLIQKPLYHVFSTSLASNGKQTNPISMLADKSMVTIMGPGGIQNQHQISKSNTSLDPSHLGFLDPVFTPESNAGVNTHMAFGVMVKDRKPHVRLYNTRTKTMEDVDAATAAISNIVLPDQVRWKNGHPAPVGAAVRMSDSKGHIRDDIKFSDAHYVMPSATQVFAVETNLVPFMQNDSAGRSSMSARHMAQAISVVGREPPKVQVEAGAGKTFESIVGSGFLAHRATADGIVKEVKKDEIIIEGKDGKKHSVHLYHHYPTNHDKGQLHSEPLVKPGDKVKAGQVLADNNFTKGGTLALGTNLRTAYLANGANHEDGLVISRSAAHKLASEHLYKPSLLTSDSHLIGRKDFLLHKATVYSSSQIKHIGDDGIVKPGSVVKPGEPLVLALNRAQAPTTASVGAQQKIGKQLKTPYNNASMIWDGDYPAEVVRTEQIGKNIVVHLKTREPAQIGSKISTRHSAKGIVSAILEDSEMPHDERGRHVELLINPAGVPGRMNPGQILETAAGKIAEKTGKPYVVKNFQGGVDYLGKIQSELKAHGLKDTEVLFDPKTGRKLGEVMVGPHYAFQLEHQIDKKTHVRSGGPDLSQFGAPKLPYDNDTKTPKGGGHQGAQSIGSLGMYAALASGLKDNIREMQTLKSDQAQAKMLWDHLQNGGLVPAPKVPFVFNKFEAMLTGLGVNVHKSGSQIRLMPRSDAEVRAKSAGEVTKPTRGIRGKDEKEEPGGLFDPRVFGGAHGERWGHIELVEPMPNPVYARAIAHTLGLKGTDPHSTLEKILEGKEKLPNGSYGGKAIREALAKLDVEKELKATAESIKDPKIKGTELGKLHFKYHALRNVKESGKRLDEAWTMQAVPVLPPIFRPQATLPDGTIKNNPLNSLYKRLGMVNDTLKAGGDKVPYNATLDTRAGLYRELANLFGTTPKGKKALELDVRGTREDKKKQLPGIIHMISGDQPKDGFFQDKMVAKKQDYTARATIVVDPNLSVDEIGVPKKIALELMRPMIAKRLIGMNVRPDEAHKMISRKDPVAIRALEKEIEHRPLLMKRDPVLHQYGLVAQKARLIDEPAIKVSPLILPPLGGDIDGDAVVLMVPLTRDAVTEAHRILPSNRTLSDSSGDVLFAPANESALSLYRMSIPRGKHNQVFSSQEEAEKAFTSNRINLNQQIHIKGVGDTTLGRVRIAQVVPEKYKKEILTSLDKPFDRKKQETLLRETAKAAPGQFTSVVDGLSQLGFRMAYESGHTVGLKDIEPLRDHRDKIIAEAKKEVEKLRAAGKDGEATEAWLRATRKLHDTYAEVLKTSPTNVSDMAPAPLGAGIKAKREQFQGLIMAPMLVEDHHGKASKVPIVKSFAEGVDVGGYFLQAAGARRGVIQKTDSVREPGYMTKLLVQANIDQPVTAHDCGTHHGLAMNIANKDVVDRHLSQSVKLGDRVYEAGHVVTPDMLAKAKEHRVEQFVVRSPLKCRMPQGVCSKCMGVHPSGSNYHVGENVGIVAAQALGERATQIMLKQTHGGGIVSTLGHGVSDFEEVQKIFDAAKRSREDAALAPRAGVIKSVQHTKGGDWHIVMDKGRKIESRQKPLAHIRPGAEVKRGDALTAGDPNINDILATKGLDAVQAHMVDRIGTIYGREGVLRRHVELAVRSATGVVRVEDPGDHSGYVRGDMVQKSVLDEINRNVLKGKTPIKYESVLVGTKFIPLRRQHDWMARLQGERIGHSILTGIQHGQSSDTTGLHPIPSLAIGTTVGLPHARPFQ